MMFLAIPAFFGYDPNDPQSDWLKILQAGRLAKIVVPEASFPGLPADGVSNARSIFDRCRARQQLILGYVTSRVGPPNNRTIPLNADGTPNTLMYATGPAPNGFFAAQDWYKPSTFQGHVDGIFVDEGPGPPESDDLNKQYYSALLANIKKIDPAHNTIMLNASQYGAEWIMNIADYVVFLEQTPNNANPAIWPTPQWYTPAKYSSKTAAVIYDIPMDVQPIAGLIGGCRGFGGFFASDSPDADYKSLPPYWSRLVAVAQAASPVPFERYYNGLEHFYTARPDRETLGPEWMHEGDVGMVFPDPPGPVPFYRVYNSGADVHFYTTSLAERDAAHVGDGFDRLEGIDGYLFGAQVAGTIPLHRFRHPDGDHFYTIATPGDPDFINAINAGYIQDSEAGYVFAADSAPSDAVPLLRYSKPGPRHFYTIQADLPFEKLGGYTLDGIACYVYPGPMGVMPFYRLRRPSTGHHFYTLDLDERDHWVFNSDPSLHSVSEGVACHIFSSQVEGTSPLHRYYAAPSLRSARDDHFYTLNPAAENLAGYVHEGIAGYVFAC